MLSSRERVTFTLAMTATQCLCAAGFNMLYSLVDRLPSLDAYRIRYSLFTCFY
jgi:hypothetical protein